MESTFKHISSLLLYDNQLNVDYFILANRRKRYEPVLLEDGKVDFIDTGEFYSTLPFEFTTTATGVLNQIYNLNPDQDGYEEKTIHLIEGACARTGLKLIKLSEPLTYIKTRSTHLPNYNGYDIYYNETKNGSLEGFELAHAWNIGCSQYSTFNLYQYCNQINNTII